jgi:hypothetical protein
MRIRVLKLPFQSTNTTFAMHDKQFPLIYIAKRCGCADKKSEVVNKELLLGQSVKNCLEILRSAAFWFARKKLIFFFLEF